MTRLNSKKPRIAIVFRGIGDIGGTNNTIIAHARSLTRLGFAVDLIGEKIRRAGVTSDAGYGVRVMRLPLWKNRRWRWFAYRADAIVAKQSYDFVAGHGHSFRQDVLSMHNSLHLAHELVHGSRLDPNGTLAEIHDELFKRDEFHFCICNSRLMQRDISDRYGIVAERLPVVYPAYRVDQFDIRDRDAIRPQTRRELGLDNQFLVGLITSGDFQLRGLDLLLEALSKVRPAIRDDISLLVLGKQSGMSRFVDQARKLGLADRIIFEKATRSPARYFHAMDLCIHPARLETFGQSVQEAMACGIPVVTTRRVGATELLPKRYYESLPESPGIEQLVCSIETFYADSDMRERWARTGHDSVRGNTLERNFEHTLGIYRAAGLPAIPGRP